MSTTEILFVSHGFNLIEKLETTLIRLHIVYEYSDIETTEQFDEKYKIGVL